MTTRLASAAAIFALAAPLASATNETFPGKPAALVYQAKGGSTYDLYRASADGKSPRAFVARPTTDEFNPAWSPSGAQVVFQSGPTDGSNFDLWLVNADGKGARPLLEGKTNDRAPQFCDGDTIVFTRQLTATSSDIWALELANGRARRLTTAPGIDSFPTCNPAATRIAFISAREGNPRIYEMAVNGSGQRPLVPGYSLDPDYSPDGRQIAYVAPDPDGYLDVFTMALATGAVTRKTNGVPPYDFRLPKYAPTVAGRSVSGASQDAGEIAATRRHRQSGTETIARTSNGTDILTGSAGTWGFTIYAPACTCKSLRVKLSPTVVFTRLRAGDDMDIKVFVEGTLRCTKGIGDCLGSMWVDALSAGLTVDEDLPIAFCNGPCNGSSRRLYAFELDGDERYGFGRRGTGTGVLYARVSVQTECNGKTVARKFQIHFDPDTGKLNYDLSDLNGDGKADGA